MIKGRPRKFTDEERLERKRKSGRDYYHNNKEKARKTSNKWKERNKEKYKKMHRDNELKRFKEFEEWKKTLKCSNCPENHVSCLEFHHLDPSKKENSITNLRNSKKKLKIELEKCIVLCSNCHKKLHYEERLTKRK